MARFTSPDGTDLAYRVVGEGAAVVCVPGGPGRAAAYLEDLGGLDRHRALVLLDMRGTGHSGEPAEPATYAFDRLAGDVEALRLHLDLDRLDLLAHSAGAVVAQTYAARHPDRLHRLVLVTPGTRLQGRPTADTEEILVRRAGEPWYSEVATAFAALRTTTDPIEWRRLLHRIAPAAYGRWEERQQDHAAGEVAQFNEEARARFWRTDGDARAVVDGLARVVAPVLVVTGACDGLTGVVAGEMVANCFPNARHVTLDGCGHYPWVDQPEPFVQAVAEFLSTD